MSWSVDAVRQAWRARERARTRAAELARANIDMGGSPEYPGPMDKAISMLASVLRPRYVVEVFNDFIIVEGDDDDAVSGPGHGSLFKVSFSVNEADGTVTFGDAEPVQIEYKPMSGVTDLHRVLLSNPMPGVDVVYTDQETQQEALLFLTLDKKKLVAVTPQT